MPEIISVRHLSVHGPGSIVRERGIYKPLFVSICCLLAAFCLSQILDTFMQFAQKETKTVLTVVEIDKTDFQAITFCPASLFIRNQVGAFPSTIAWAYANLNGFGDFATAQTIGGKMCSDPNGSKIPVDLSNSTTYNRVFFDSNRVVKQCLFNGKPFECEGTFLNHQAEAGWCFTFNPSKSIIDQFTNDTNGDKLTPYAYGIDTSRQRNFYLRSGLRNSLTFTMDIHMNQTCIPLLENLAGIVVLLHDSNIFPFFSTKRLILLPPGYSANVAVSTKVTKRFTESIGKCQSSIKLIYSWNETEYTNKDAYFIDCLTDVVVKKCGCLPYFAGPSAYSFKRWDEFVCASSEATIHRGLCMDNAVKHEYLVERSCYKRIPTPCNEVVITGFPVYKIFPSTNVFGQLQRNLNVSTAMSLKEFRQTFLSVNFYMKDEKYTLIQEYPKMTWIDLLNQCGGTLGMCLGGSIISLVELVVLILVQSVKMLLHGLEQCSQRPQIQRHHYHNS